MAKRTYRYSETLLRAVARVLEPWLLRILQRLEEFRHPIAPTSSDERGSEVLAGEAPSGAPAHWVEKVRHGAPHLLRPRGQPAVGPGAIRTPQVAQTRERPVPKPQIAESGPSTARAEKPREARAGGGAETDALTPETPRKEPRGEVRPPRLLPASSVEADMDFGKTRALAHLERRSVPEVAAPTLLRPAPQPPGPLRHDRPPTPARELETRVTPVQHNPLTAKASPPAPRAPIAAAAEPQRPFRRKRAQATIPTLSPTQVSVAPEFQISEPTGANSATATGSEPEPILAAAPQSSTPRRLLKQNEAPEQIAVNWTPLARPFDQPRPSLEPKDRWPMLPRAPQTDAVDDALAVWREHERRRYLLEEQEGTYGPRRISPRR